MGSSATSNFGCFTLARGERARTARGALLGEGDTALRGEGDVAFRGDLCGRGAGIVVQSVKPQSTTRWSGRWRSQVIGADGYLPRTYPRAPTAAASFLLNSFSRFFASASFCCFLDALDMPGRAAVFTRGRRFFGSAQSGVWARP